MFRQSFPGGLSRTNIGFSAAHFCDLCRSEENATAALVKELFSITPDGCLLTLNRDRLTA